MAFVTDLAGLPYGSLSAIRHVADPRPGAYWLCDCTCGHAACRGTCVKAAKSLVSGATKSCGAKTAKRDRSGNRCGDLRVLRRADPRPYGGTMWVCECRCGRPDCKREVVWSDAVLKLGKRRSCGAGDRSGEEVGSLRIVRRGDVLADGRERWVCECSCGHVRCKGSVAVVEASMDRGDVLSCGLQMPRVKMIRWRGMAMTFAEVAFVLRRSRCYVDSIGLPGATPEQVDRRRRNGPLFRTAPEDFEGLDPNGRLPTDPPQTKGSK